MKLKFKKALVSLAMTAIAVTGLGVTGVAPASAAGASHGCAYGSVCLYKYSDGINHWATGKPDWIRSSYNTYELPNMINNYYIFNNQYGGAKAGLCVKQSGGGTCYYYSQSTYSIVNMTYYWSIKIVPH